MSLPSGVYNAEVKAAYASKTRSSVSRSSESAISLRFEITSGDQKGEIIEYQGSLSTETMRNGMQIRELTRQNLRTCGWDGTRNIDTCVGGRVQIVVEHGERSGTPYVKYINAITSEPLKGKAADDALADLLAEAPAGATRQGSHPKQQAFIADDDYPFK